MVEFNTHRYCEETDFEYKLRLCKAKLNGEIDLSWSEIVDLLGLYVSADHLRKTAYGIIEYDNYINNNDIVATRILCISDLHIPFNLPVETFKDYVGKVDILMLNGDINDFQAISKFSKVYRISPMQEIIEAREHIINLINYIRPHKVYINKGNHDQRFQNYLAKNLDSDLLALTPETQLDLIIDDGFTYYDKMNHCKVYYEPIANMFDFCDVVYTCDWKFKIGNIWFLHPLAYFKSTLKTVENAMNYLHRNEKEYFSSVVLGHTHKIGYTKIGDVHLFEQGCCCQTDKLNYMDGKLVDPQKQGFMYICQDKNGNIILDKTKLICLN